NDGAGGTNMSQVQRSVATPPEQWHKAHVRAVGEIIEIAINGTLVNRFNLKEQRAKLTKHVVPQRTEGRIGLRQNTKVEYRNVKIKELPPEKAVWVRLFNGKNFDGWIVDKRVWKIEDGAMVADGFRGIQTTGSMPKHFHLRFEVNVKTPGA